VFDLNWVQYADNGYDPLQDRDFYSRVLQRDVLIRSGRRKDNEDDDQDPRFRGRGDPARGRAPASAKLTDAEIARLAPT